MGPTKSRRARVVSLGQNAATELRSWRAIQAEQLLRPGVRQTKNIPVCTNADGSHRLAAGDHWRLLALRQAPRAQRAFPSLRHRHATALLNAGVHPKVAQERLGHHSVAFTLDRYSHTIEQMHDDAAAKVDGIFGPSVSK